MAKWIIYIGADGKKHLRHSDEYIKHEEDKKRKKEKEQLEMYKKNKNEYWLNKWIEKRRFKRQNEYIEKYIVDHLYCDKELISRFFEKVDIKDDNECWKWLKSVRTDGYGVFRIGKLIISAHRMSWILIYGEIHKDMHILHNCDNKLCVNPKHLREGTHQDNMNDMFEKKTTTIGEKSIFHKLTWEQVNDIRKKYNLINNITSLSKEYHVHPKTIKRIVKNITWRI